MASNEANAQEPTMEEILASIRRIISEDTDEAPKPEAEEAEPAPSPAPAVETEAKAAPPPPVEEVEAIEEEEDVLELTDIVPDEEPSTPAPAPMPAAKDDDDVVMVEREPASPPRRPMAATPVNEEDEVGLISDEVRTQASTSFMQLARNVKISEGEPHTLEALVQEMLRPVLEEWLNTNLPSIVEQLVQQEIERVSRRGRY